MVRVSCIHRLIILVVQLHLTLNVLLVSGAQHILLISFVVVSLSGSQLG